MMEICKGKEKIKKKDSMKQRVQVEITTYIVKKD
jgi:hypothetical protein